MRDEITSTPSEVLAYSIECTENILFSLLTQWILKNGYKPHEGL